MFSPYPMQSLPFPTPPPYAHPYSQVAWSGGRGLLGRLFQGIGGASKFSSFAGAQMQPMNLMSVIENTQKVINIVQNVTPVFQQYGPLIRNLPAIYKILKESPTTETTTNQVPLVDQQATNDAPSQSPILVKEQTVEPKITPMIAGNIPAPKMYV